MSTHSERDKEIITLPTDPQNSTTQLFTGTSLVRVIADPSADIGRLAQQLSTERGTAVVVEAPALYLDVGREHNYLKNLAKSGAVALCRQQGGKRGVIGITVAYADGNTVYVRQGDIPGIIASIADPEQDWEQIFVPHGHSGITYAQLKEHHPWNTDKRTRLLMALAAQAGIPTGEIYETHISVKCDDQASFHRFRELCGTLGVKAIHIALAQGDHPSQVITSSHYVGSLEDSKRVASELGRTIGTQGFEVIRTKIERMLSPRDQRDEGCNGNGQYYEFHVKMPIRDGMDRARIEHLCNEHGAHFSRNASNALEGGVDWFATMRGWDTTRATAVGRFEELLTVLRGEGLSLSNILHERTVHDDGIRLDAGWGQRGWRTY